MLVEYGGPNFDDCCWDGVPLSEQEACYRESIIKWGEWLVCLRLREEVK